MPRASTIKTSRHREAIESAIAAGVPAVEISTRFNVSPSAVARYKSNRNDAIAAALDDDSPMPDEVLARLADLADSATKSRKLADASGSAAIRARAQATELAALNTLIDRLGIDDLSTVRLAQGSGVVVRTLQEIAERHPEIQADIIAIMREHDELQTLADDLAAILRKKNDD